MGVRRFCAHKSDVGSEGAGVVASAAVIKMGVNRRSIWRSGIWWELVAEGGKNTRLRPTGANGSRCDRNGDDGAGAARKWRTNRRYWPVKGGEGRAPRARARAGFRGRCIRNAHRDKPVCGGLFSGEGCLRGICQSLGMVILSSASVASSSRAAMFRNR